MSKKKNNEKVNKQKSFFDDKRIEHVEQKANKLVKKGFYLGYNTRIILLFISLVACLVSIYFTSGLSVKKLGSYYVDVNEKGSIDYKVYLKENSFYDKEFLPKGMSYVSNLIKNIKVDYDYHLKSTDDLNIDYNYQVIANLIILDPNNNNSTFFTKEYVLYDSKEENIKGDKLDISKEIDIDYDYYNGLSNRFKSNYGIDANSKLVIYFKVNKKSDTSTLNNDSKSMVLSIPLSQKALNISFGENNIDSSRSILKTKETINYNIVFLVVTVIISIISLIVTCKLVRLIVCLSPKKSKYDKFVGKLLIQYDRVIAETEYMPNLDNLNVYKMKKLNELLDVRDNLKLPIMFYSVTDHVKCNFYIKKDDDIYIYTVKESDFK